MWRWRLPDCSATKKCGAMVLKMNWARKTCVDPGVGALERLSWGCPTWSADRQCQRIKRRHQLLRWFRPQYPEYDWPNAQVQSTAARGKQLAQF